MFLMMSEARIGVGLIAASIAYVGLMFSRLPRPQCTYVDHVRVGEAGLREAGGQPHAQGEAVGFLFHLRNRAHAYCSGYASCRQ